MHSRRLSIRVQKFLGGRGAYTYGPEGQPIFTSGADHSFIGPYACRVSFSARHEWHFPESTRSGRTGRYRFLSISQPHWDIWTESDLLFHVGLLDGYQLFAWLAIPSIGAGPISRPSLKFPI